MTPQLHYYANSGRWVIVDHDGHPVDHRANAVTLLKQCDLLPKTLVTLLIARRFALEVRANGLFDFFLSDSGVIAPNAHAALRRLHLHMPARVLDEAMRCLGPHFPQRLERRREILMHEWIVDAPHGPLTDRLRDLTREFYSSAGGIHMDLLTDSMRQHVDNILDNTDLGIILNGSCPAR